MWGHGGGHKAYGVVGNLGGNRQAVGGGVESPQGTDTPGVDALTQEDGTSRVATEGDKVTGEDRQRQGGDEPPPTTRASKDNRAKGSNGGMTSGQRTLVSLLPRETVAEDDSVGPLMRKSDGADGTRTENGTHSGHKYGLLALEETEGGGAIVGPRERGDGLWSTYCLT